MEICTVPVGKERPQIEKGEYRRYNDSVSQCRHSERTKNDAGTGLFVEDSHFREHAPNMETAVRASYWPQGRTRLDTLTKGAGHGLAKDDGQLHEARYYSHQPQFWQTGDRCEAGSRHLGRPGAAMDKNTSPTAMDLIHKQGFSGY